MIRNKWTRKNRCRKGGKQSGVPSQGRSNKGEPLLAGETKRNETRRKGRSGGAVTSATRENPSDPHVQGPDHVVRLGGVAPGRFEVLGDQRERILSCLLSVSLS